MLYRFSRSFTALFFPFLLFASTVPAFGQDRIGFWQGTNARDYFGYDVAGLGDLDGDGFADFASNAYSSFHIQILSSKTGAELHHIPGVSDFHDTRYQLTAAGDLNGDGFTDLMYLEYLEQTDRSTIWAVSGKDFSVLHTIPVIRQTNVGNGYRLEAGQDIDLDGYDDFIVAASCRSGSFPWYWQVYSGKTGQVLAERQGQMSESLNTVKFMGDFNSDGYPEIATAIKDNNSSKGRVKIYSGKDYQFLYSVTDDNAFSNYGSTVIPLADQTGDGVADFAVGAPRPWGQNGKVHFYNGKYGTRYSLWTGNSTNPNLGTYMFNVGDVSHDGFEDFILSPRDASQPIRLYSGATRNQLYAFPQAQYGNQGQNIARGGDINQDGIQDLLMGDSWEGFGEIYAFAGNDLYLQESKTTISPFEAFSLTASEGSSEDEIILFLESINGNPVWFPLTHWEDLDVTGLKVFNLNGPAAAPPGTTLSFRTYLRKKKTGNVLENYQQQTITPSQRARWVDSNTVVITMQ